MYVDHIFMCIHVYVYIFRILQDRKWNQRAIVFPVPQTPTLRQNPDWGPLWEDSAGHSSKGKKEENGKWSEDQEQNQRMTVIPVPETPTLGQHIDWGPPWEDNTAHSSNGNKEENERWGTAQGATKKLESKGSWKERAEDGRWNGQKAQSKDEPKCPSRGWDADRSVSREAGWAQRNNKTTEISDLDGQATRQATDKTFLDTDTEEEPADVDGQTTRQATQPAAPPEKRLDPPSPELPTDLPQAGLELPYTPPDEATPKASQWSKQEWKEWQKAKSMPKDGRCSETMSQQTCTFWMKSRCKKGNNCKFLHQNQSW